MLNGKCQLLIDGIDELDPGEEKIFQRRLSATVDKYPFNQYILSSRECDTLKGIKGFRHLYLWPLNKDQTKALINKLVKLRKDKVSTEDIMDFLTKGFMAEHDYFATNPMMLTFIIQNFPIEESFKGKTYLFYKNAYDTFIREHDIEKAGFDRVFHSVSTPDDFTKVFREFCANTYRQQIFKFDRASFEKYFNEIRCKKYVNNPKMMKATSFRRDACETACMMFEEESNLLYFDRGIQQYLFAEFNYMDDPKNVIKMGKSLWHISIVQYENDMMAFDMLYEMSQEKTEMCLFIPLLDKIFKGRDDDEAFEMYLKFGFQSYEYIALDQSKRDKIGEQLGITFNDPRVGTTDPSNIILSMIFKYAKVNCETNQWFNDPQLVQQNYLDEAYDVLVYEVNRNTSTEEKTASAKMIPALQYNKYKDEENENIFGHCIRDDSGSVLCFGYQATLKMDKILREKEKYSDIISNLKSSKFYESFQASKEYYAELIEKYDEKEF